MTLEPSCAQYHTNSAGSTSDHFVPDLVEELTFAQSLIQCLHALLARCRLRDPVEAALAVLLPLGIDWSGVRGGFVADSRIQVSFSGSN